MKFISTYKTKITVFFLLILILPSTACLGGKKVPDLAKIFAGIKTQKGKRPVIIIPGILGSELVNPKTDQKVWLDFSIVKGDGLSLPISPDLSKNRDDLVARRIIEKAKVFRFFPEVSVYQALISAMENFGGYQPGDWENPDPDGGWDHYYVFAYDWRLDNVENGRLLARNIAELKQKLNEPDLRFNVIAHSMGGLVVRYAAMYGDTDLPPAETEPKPNWSGTKLFNKIFMFGTPNEGSMDALEVILKGYRVSGFYVGSLNRETILTSPSIFQLLPHRTSARFYDENLKPLDIDLYDPETWKKYSWSAYSDPAFLSKFKGQANAVDAKGNRSEFADVTLDELDGYFKNMLKRTKAFHNALDADTSVPPAIAFFAFGGDCDDTQDGAFVYKDAKTDAWKTLFSPRQIKTADGKKISKQALKALLFAPGDGRVTRTSLLAANISRQNNSSPIFRTSLPVTATFFCEAHDELPNNQVMQNNFLTALIAEIAQ